MKLSYYRSGFLLIIIGVAFFSLSGQVPSSDAIPSGLVIEVHSGRPGGMPIIPLSREKSQGFWASGFPRLKDWKLPAGEEPAQEIDFRAQIVGDKAKLVVSILKGKRFGENAEMVATVTLSEGDEVTVNEFRKFGFEPMTFKMVKIAIKGPEIPAVVNPAKSLKVVVSSALSTLPTVRVKVINQSGKAVLALPFHTEDPHGKLLSGILQGKYGKPLMSANEEYETTISVNRADDDEGKLSFVIDAAVYEDQTFDGDKNEAGRFLSFQEGRKKALLQLVPILKSAVGDDSQKLDIEALIATVDAVTNPGEKQVNGRASTPEGVAFAATVKETLDVLRKFASESSRKTGTEVRSGILEISRFCDEWLEAISK